MILHVIAVYRVLDKVGNFPSKLYKSRLRAPRDWIYQTVLML